MSLLTIDAFEVIAESRQTRVEISLTDENHVPVLGYHGGAIVHPYKGRTDINGHLAINLYENADISPANTRYTVLIGRFQVLILKGAGPQTLQQAQVGPVGALTSSTDLDDLADVNATTPNAGDVITWSGTEWVAAPATGGAPTNATYVVATANAALTNEEVLTEGEGIDITSAAGTITVSGEDASTTNKGIVELATSVEVTAGLAVQASDTRLSDARTPTAHAASHKGGGSDVIDNAVAAGSAGLMSGADKTKLDGIAAGATVYTDEAARDAVGAALVEGEAIDIAISDPGDTITISAEDATTSNKGVVELATSAETTAGLAVQASDTRLSDPRTPTAHAATHVTGGGDTIASAVAAGNAGLMTGADKSKLDGIAAGATVYTAENARDDVGAALVAGEGIDITISDPGDTITIDAELGTDTNPGVLELATNAETVTGTDTARATTPAGVAAALAVVGSYTDEQARDAIGTALVAGEGIDITVSDPGNTITIDAELASTTNPGVVELATDGEVAANVAVQGNDARLSNSRTPTAHATSHVTGGTDVIANAVASGNAGLLSGADKAKLDGIATGATVYTDENARDALGTALVAGEGIDITVSDGSDTITIDAELSSDTNPGVIEIATNAEVIGAVDTTRAVTAAGLSAFFQTYVPNGGIFGDGSDGDVTITGGTTTLARDMYYNNLTITSTGILKPARFRVFVKGTLTIDASGDINDNGNNGNVGVGGAALAAAFLGASGAGGAGGAGAGNAGGNVTESMGGAGGAGGAGNGGANAGGAAGTVTATPAAAGGSWRYGPGLLLGRSATTSFVRHTGGAGGGSGGGDGSGNAGGGGGGAGVIRIAARLLVNNGTIRANGGNGANGPAGNRGGGGGGGGGSIGLVYMIKSGSGTITVAAGTFGTGLGTGSNGVAGSAGTIVEVPTL